MNTNNRQAVRLREKPAVNEKTLLIAAIAYVALTVFSNIGSLRILLLAGLSVDGGSLLYPFTFTMRDILHKKVGAKNTRLVIIIAAVVNLFLFAFVALISALPADTSVGPQTEFALVLNPGIRLVLGSVVAMTLAELIDTQIYSLIRKRFEKRHQWLRVVLSNLVSVPIDTIVFLLIAFAGTVSTGVIISMFIANLLIKYVVSLFSVFGIYLIKDDRK